MMAEAVSKRNGDGKHGGGGGGISKLVGIASVWYATLAATLYTKGAPNVAIVATAYTACVGAAVAISATKQLNHTGEFRAAC